MTNRPRKVVQSKIEETTTTYYDDDGVPAPETQHHVGGVDAGQLGNLDTLVSENDVPGETE